MHGAAVVLVALLRLFSSRITVSLPACATFGLVALAVKRLTRL
jgi:hypothetical protein